MNKYLLLFFFASIALISCKQDSNSTMTDSTSSAEKTNNPEYYDLFIGTYTRTEPHVAGKAEGIYWYQMNKETGEISHVSTFPGMINPSYLVIAPGGGFLYAVNEHGGAGDFDAGTISAFRINKAQRKLELLNQQSVKGAAPCYVSIAPSGKHALVSNYVSGNSVALPILKDGSLAELSSEMQSTGSGPHPRQESPHAHMILPGPGGFIHTVDLGLDKVLSYTLSSEGELKLANEVSTKPGAGPRHLAFHPNEKWAYVVNELNGTVEAFSYDKTSATFNRIQDILTTVEPLGDQAACADIHVHPSGKFLYASNRGESNSIAMYSIDQESGLLTFMGLQSVKGRTPRSFVIAPGGAFLLVANQDSGNVVSFKINPETGLLEDIGVESEVPTPVCLKFML